MVEKSWLAPVGSKLFSFPSLLTLVRSVFRPARLLACRKDRALPLPRPASSLSQPLQADGQARIRPRPRVPCAALIYANLIDPPYSPLLIGGIAVVLAVALTIAGRALQSCLILPIPSARALRLRDESDRHPGRCQRPVPRSRLAECRRGHARTARVDAG